ncbi:MULTISPECIES: hypothetical protein [Massilia]|jgi:hypothetical protein|uniref:hypothetical protein n=1 Tax=Massilia TaxID=149698 RepID=UPI0012EB87B1|nr:hypothetical protein [Massilia alkalitolerans]
MSITASRAGDKQSPAARLHAELLARYPDNFMLYADLFAMGCLMHLQGQHRAGLKLIDQVRRALPTTGTKTYFSDLLHTLPGNEVRFAGEVQAHLEVNELFELAQRQLASPERASAVEAGLAVVTEVRTHNPSTDCPHCRTTFEWHADPRGRQDTCDRCKQPFAIAHDATVIFD